MVSDGGDSQDPSRPSPGNRAATAAYITDLSADLARMAREDGLATLAYLLDMARLEAQSLAQQSKRSAY